MFDGYLSVGTRSREYLRHFGVPEPLIFDSPHAIDVSAGSSLAANGEARPVMRRWLGASDGDFLIVFAGKFTGVKRAADLVAAAARMGPDVTLAMVGNGPLMKETRAMAQRLGVRATWCGFVNQSTMPSVLAAADCVALPSQSETWGFVVSEALACGTPCVVSDRVGCAPDLIHDGVQASFTRSAMLRALSARCHAFERRRLAVRSHARYAVRQQQRSPSRGQQKEFAAAPIE
jgi:glycosyltransferase involved in cell wall biosynthesis